MRKDAVNKIRAGFGLIEILLVLVLLSVGSYVMINLYFKKAYHTDKTTAKVLSEQGIDTTNYKTILGSTKKKIKDVEKQQAEGQKQLEEMKN